MSKLNRKSSISSEHRRILTSLHIAQILVEIALAMLILSLFTINISSVLQWYGAIDVIVMVVAAIVLFVAGINLSIYGFGLRRQSQTLRVESSRLRFWLKMVWGWSLGYLIIGVIIGIIEPDKYNVAKAIFFCVTTLIVIISIAFTLFNSQLLWKSYFNNNQSWRRPVLYASIAGAFGMLTIFGSYTTFEVVKPQTTYVSDSNLELGQSEVRQKGVDGQKQTKHNLIFGYVEALDETPVTDTIVAKGTKRYQYMYCSDGSYRYYSAKQFKDPEVGFTHQSPDYCAKNGQGTQTTIADTPPPKTQTTYVPTYRSPSTTHCYSFSSYSVDCYSY